MRQVTKRFGHFLRAVVACLVATSQCVGGGIDAVPASIVQGNNAFAFDLYRQSVTPDTENFVYSPFSISSAFGMLYAGANGSTAEEIARVMHWSVDEPHVHAALGAISSDLNARNGEQFDLAVANRLWGAVGFPFQQPFLDTLQSSYRAPLQTVDFWADPEAGRRRINAWVSDQTRNKIPDLLPQGSVNRDTGLVLTNAVYMKAKWQSPFKKESTFAREFHVSSDESLNVSMMSQLSSMRYGDFDGYQMVEMPYQDGDVSMVVVLPSEIDGLAALEAGLTPDLLESSYDAMTRTPVSLRLPKFQVETSLGLNDSLTSLGMVETFGNADLSRIAGGGLEVSSAIHKAVIEVDEDGTEAAAATAIVVGLTSVYQPPQVYETFHADHPFLYVLRDQRTESILFMGRLMRPEFADHATILPPGDFIVSPGEPVLLPDFVLNPGGVQVPEPSSITLAVLAVALLSIAPKRLTRRDPAAPPPARSR
jgi:serpin B